MLFYYFVLRDDERAIDALLKSISEHQLFAVLYAQSPFTRELRLSKEWSRVVQEMKLRDLADATVQYDDD
jgi:hypothetical protein